MRQLATDLAETTTKHNTRSHLIEGCVKLFEYNLFSIESNTKYIYNDSYYMKEKKSYKQRLADVSLFLPFAPVFVYIYGGFLLSYVKWQVKDLRESINNK